ncbi:MAG: hypothetical protein M5R42_09615 [Rhodocyclaceae bacterium]|nr:hypothetical protein [Rhodocyclaceae bacterium]
MPQGDDLSIIGGEHHHVSLAGYPLAHPPPPTGVDLVLSPQVRASPSRPAQTRRHRRYAGVRVVMSMIVVCMGTARMDGLFWRRCRHMKPD